MTDQPGSIQGHVPSPKVKRKLIEDPPVDDSNLIKCPTSMLIWRSVCPYEAPIATVQSFNKVTRYYTILYSTRLYSILLFSTLLYYTIPYYTILYNILLHHAIIYCIILYHTHNSKKSTEAPGRLANISQAVRLAPGFRQLLAYLRRWHGEIREAQKK